MITLIRMHSSLFAQVLAEEGPAQEDGTILLDENHYAVADDTVPEGFIVVGDSEPQSVHAEIERRRQQDERLSRIEAQRAFASVAALASLAPSGMPDMEHGLLKLDLTRGSQKRLAKRGGTQADIEAMRKAEEKRQRKARAREEQARKTAEGQRRAP